MTDHTNDGAILGTCPHLGLADDPSTCRLYASADHRCYRWRGPEPVEISYQLAFCLSADYRDCFRLVSPVDRSLFRKAQASRAVPRGRVLVLIAVASAILLLASMSSNWPYWATPTWGVSVEFGDLEAPLADAVPSSLEGDALPSSVAPSATLPTSVPTTMPTQDLPSTPVESPSESTPGEREASPGCEAQQQTSEPSQCAREVSPTRATTLAPTEQAATSTPQSLTPTAQPVATTPRAAVPDPAPSPVGTSAGTRYYVVQPGDNLYRVASRFGVTVEDMAKANDLENESIIWVGQRLVIP